MHRLDIFKGYNTVQFDSLSDIGDYIQERRKARAWTSVKREPSEFNNWHSFDDSVKEMLYGYSHPEKLMEGLRDFVDSEVLDTGGLCMDIEGSAYDMGAVVQGVPECCIADTRVEEKKHVRFVCSVGFSAGVEAKYILNRSIAIANLIGTLMLKGYIVDLDFLMVYNESWGEDKKKAAFFVRIPTGSFCSSTIAFLTSPQFLRRICISVPDFILDKDINGAANGYKEGNILEWCKKNSLYFPDGYDDDDHSCSEKYGTIEYAERTINGIYEDWLNSKKN